MLEADIQKLVDRDLDRSLDTLEADVWRGIEANARMSRTIDVITAWQAVVVALALITGVATGNVVARANATDTSQLGTFSPNTGLAPSTLLLGGRRI